LKRLLLLLICAFCILSAPPWVQGQPPACTLDFETGTLDGWQASGRAFHFQPTLGDNPARRHRGQPSNHQGSYWIGTYEKYQGRPGQRPGDIQGDAPRGELSSPVFVIPSGSLSFLVGGGSSPDTRVELDILNDRDDVGYSTAYQVSGMNTETMRRVEWDLDPYSGKRGMIRIIDNSSGGWGHINADDFRFIQKIHPSIPHPAVSISPPSLTVRRGEEAVFRARLTVSNTKYRFSWRGPGGSHAQGPVFRIDTSSLSPGRYGVGLMARSPAITAAQEVLKAKAVLEVLPPPVTFRLSLQVDPRQAGENSLVNLRANLTPYSRDARFFFYFGDGGSSGWIKKNSTSHRYRVPGHYTAKASARPGNDKMVESNMVPVIVRPANYRLLLKTDKHAVQAGETVTIMGRLQPKNPGANYRLLIDGAAVSALRPECLFRHPFTRPGVHLVQLEALLGNRTVRSNTAEIRVRETFRVMLSANPYRTEAGRKVHFTAKALPQGPSLEYIFSFGDGVQKNNGNSPGVVHAYEKQGVYQAVVKVLSGGEEVAESKPVRIEVKKKPPPVIRVGLKVEPSSVAVGEPVRFDASLQPEDVKAEYCFFFGDGNSKCSLLAPGTDYSYDQPGRYLAHAEVRENRRILAKSQQVLVTVNPGPGPHLNVLIKSDKDSTLVGQEVVFTAETAPRRANVLFSFVFGDEEFKEEKSWSPDSSASHSYRRPGVYRVKALARGPEGKIFESQELDIIVKEPPAPPAKPPTRQPTANDWPFWAAAALLLGVFYGIFKIMKKKAGSERGKPTGTLSGARVRINKDPGTQEIYCDNTLVKGPETKILPVTDSGVQEIEDI